MAFIPLGASNLASALMQQQPISTGPTRSQLVNQFLQQQAAQQPRQIQSYGEGFARLGSNLVDALMSKQGIDEQMQQQDALARQDAARRQAFAQALGVQGDFSPEQALGVAQFRQGQQEFERSKALEAERLQAQREKAVLEAEAKKRQAEAERLQQELENRLKERETQLKERQATPEYKAEVKAAETRAAGEEKAALEAPEKIAALEGFRGGLERTRQLIQELKTHPNREDATGYFDQFMPSFSQATRDFDAKLKELKGQLTLDKLAAAKQSGVSFGATSEKEISLASEAAGALDPWVGDEAFLDQLIRLEKRLDSGIAQIDKDIATRREKLPAKTHEELLSEIYQ